MSPDCFADEPARFFLENDLFVHHLPRSQQESLQLSALQKRFVAMRDAIPPLTALADTDRISEITRLEDGAALLFPHTLYKSYPAEILNDLRFPELTEWLSRLTLIDLSAIKA